MNSLIIITPEGNAAFLNWEVERYERGVAPNDVFDLPPTEWMDIDDTSGGSGAPAQAGCV